MFPCPRSCAAPGRDRHACLLPARLFLTLCVGWILALGAGCAGRGTTHDDPAAVAAAGLARTGEPAPGFRVATLDGGSFDLAAQRGKVVLVNWWATWCPPCVAEMPHLQTQVWDRFRGPDFAMIAVSREETAEVLSPWIKERGLTFPIGLDPDRAAYGLYATAYIPRSYVVDRTGTVVFQSQGYEEPQFAAMVEAIAAALAAPAPEVAP